MRQAIVYGLDIEIDTAAPDLDTALAPILTVALAHPGGEEVFTGPEDELLVRLDAAFAELAPGVIATWNGGAFDLPFIADRARYLGLDVGLRLRLDPKLPMRTAPLPGHEGAYRASWYRHCHLDAFRLYHSQPRVARTLAGSLRALARGLGLIPQGNAHVEPDDLRNEALHAYAEGDARLARVLTERRWDSAARFVDRLVAPAQPVPA
ncbi:MAG: 3'-5' exonuclease [Acidimicrobiia bacterium]